MGIESNNSVGAPEGNQNAKKGKLFYDQLRRALVQNDSLKLRAIAEKLVEKAEEGESWAVKEIMDRIDGKAVQPNTLEDENGKTVFPHIQVSFVKPNDRPTDT
jgi:hypothetical protein